LFFSPEIIVDPKFDEAKDNVADSEFDESVSQVDFEDLVHVIVKKTIFFDGVYMQEWRVLCRPVKTKISINN